MLGNVASLLRLLGPFRTLLYLLLEIAVQSTRRIVGLVDFALLEI